MLLHDILVPGALADPNLKNNVDFVGMSPYHRDWSRIGLSSCAFYFVPNFTASRLRLFQPITAHLATLLLLPLYFQLGCHPDVVSLLVWPGFLDYFPLPLFHSVLPLLFLQRFSLFSIPLYINLSNCRYHSFLNKRLPFFFRPVAIILFFFFL